MPIISPFKLFEHHDLINLYFKEVTNGCTKIGSYLTFDLYDSRSNKEHYLFLKNGSEIIALCCFFFYEYADKKIPAIDIVVVEENFRRNGIVSFFYEHLLEKYNYLISGICLNKNSRKRDGSFGLWLNKLFKKHSHGIYNIFENKIEKYSFYKAFKSSKNLKRRLIIWNENKF